jgi:uncharacterized protein YaiI (UPF0178 family)
MTESPQLLPRILVDADGCPVKQEVFKVARRHGLKVTLAANSRMAVPREDMIELVVVSDDFDAADDWIVEHIKEYDIAVTWDIPLAARCLEKGAFALSPKGRVFSENSIGDALANREVQSHLRELGVMTGGPAPFRKKDRSRFLHSLDELVNKARRR